MNCWEYISNDRADFVCLSSDCTVLIRKRPQVIPGGGGWGAHPQHPPPGSAPVTIDNRLSFDNHVSVICKKINNQFNVMLTFRKLINKETLLKLYKAFILPHFYYCSSVWHSCGARNADKVDNLNKRILRFILQDYSSPYDILLSKVNLKSLFIRRLQNFMIKLYKSLFFTNYPGYLKDMFTLRSSSSSSEFKQEILRYEAFPQ